jgi:hypothetical protein
VKEQDHRNGMRTDTPVGNDPALVWALQLAKSIFAHEKATHIGRVPVTTTPTTVYFAAGGDRVHVLTGSVFRRHAMPNCDQHDLARRLLACCTDASAVLSVRAGWEILRCAACGRAQVTLRSPRERIGMRTVRAHKTPCRRWMICCNLKLRESYYTWSWCSTAALGPQNQTCCWEDLVWGKAREEFPDPRYYGPWRLKKWMQPHFKLNYPSVLAILGRQPEPGSEATARRIEARASAYPPLLRVDPARLENAIRVVKVVALRRIQCICGCQGTM